MGKEGSLKEPINVREMEKWDILETNKNEMEDELAEFTRKEQQLWLDNRGYEEYTYGERCSRKFFDGMRTSMAFSHIKKAFSKTSNVCATSTNEILGYIREFYCGTNGILNLSHKHTLRSDRCEKFLDKYRNDPELNREGETTENEKENKNTKTRRRCRNVILKAIQADGKVLDKEQSISLKPENLFTPENVQKAIDALTTETTPGRDGWPAQFYKTIGKRVDTEDPDPEKKTTLKKQPSPLARLLTKVFLECAEKGELFCTMKDSTVSLIYKEKGKRSDIGKYRPIAVNSIIYRIMAKTIVIVMSPVLGTVTSTNQKAFKPGELLSDNTRQVQDIIHYCEKTNIPGLILFADQDGAYPRVNWDYLFDVMEAMNFDDDFIKLIRTMYSEVTLHFKINGVIDPIATKPGNGIAQGCPASPCLYLLCIQGLISLIKRDQ